MAKVLVIGGNFAGLTAALETRRRLHDKSHDITVISMKDHFLYVPSLIWVPFKEREIDDIVVPIEPVLRRHGVNFINETALKIDPFQSKVTTDKGNVFDYDYLVIATGPDLDLSLPGSDPALKNNTYIGTPAGALEIRQRFFDLLDNPGPVVVGAAPRAGCIGASYEFLFNIEYHLRRRGVRQKSPVVWVTPEPYLGHFGMDGVFGGSTSLKLFMNSRKIDYRVNAAIASIDKEKVTLESGEVIESALTMIMPPFLGQEVVRNSPGLGNEKGFIPVLPTYQHRDFSNIFAAGVAVDVPPFGTTPIPVGVPKTGFPAETEARIVAENISRVINGNHDLTGKPFGEIPGVCVMDAGHKEVLIYANHFARPRQFSVVLPNPTYNTTKRFLEKYFLWKARTGLARLP
jgi:sulfide:quinone oxidoreductase